MASRVCIARCAALPSSVWGVGAAERVLGGGVAGERLLDLVGLALGQEHEHDRALVAGLGGRLLHRRLGDRPLVADPHRDVALVEPTARPGPSGWSILRGVLLAAVGELESAERRVDGRDEPLAAELVHPGGVVADGGEPAPVVLLPLGALFGLEPVLVVDAHEPALGDERVEQLGHALAELGAVVGEVLDEEVGEERRGGAQPGLAAERAAGNLRDQEDRARRSGPSARRRRPRSQAADELVDLLEQHAALQHADGDCSS